MNQEIYTKTRHQDEMRRKTFYRYYLVSYNKTQRENKNMTINEGFSKDV